MLKNIEVTQDLLDYIYNHTKPLHDVQKDILSHNKNLGDLQRMQIAETQAHLLQLIIKMISSGKISGKIAKEVFVKMQAGDKNPEKIVEKEGLTQQSNPKELDKTIDIVLSKNQDKVSQYKSGKEKLFGYFVGEVMKASKGKANPQLVNQILKKKLK